MSFGEPIAVFGEPIAVFGEPIAVFGEPSAVAETTVQLRDNGVLPK